MNKKTLLIMFILLIPVYALNSTSTSTNTSNIKLLSTTQTHGLTFQKPITLTSYTSPYQVKILFDDNHTGYWSSSKFEIFIQDIEEYFGANVTINDKMFNETDLSEYDILIMPEFDTNLTETEIIILRQYLENGGVILFMGDRDPYFGYPESLNATTLDYGIGWYADQIYDDTNYDYRNYYPIVHVWGNNTVAKFLSNDKTYEVKFRGSPVLIVGSNTTNYTIYIIGIGDDDTYTDSGRLYDGNITFFAAVDIVNGGRFFASGSTEMFRTDNYYQYLNTGFDNKNFAMRLIHWLMAEGLEISSVEYPTGIMKAGETAYINMTIVNNENVDATNVKVSIEINGTLEVLNGSQEFTVDTLSAGASKTITWKVMATGTSEAKVIVKVWSDNLKGFSKAFTITTKGFSVDVKASPKYLIMGTNVTLEINVTNPEGSGVNATNVNITITVPDAFTTSNDTLYHYDWINESTYVYLKLVLTSVGAAEPATISVFVESENFGTATKTAEAYVFPGRIALFYDTYVGYFHSFRYEHFLENVSTFRHVFVLTEPLTEEILNLTDLVIMPDVDEPVPQDEVELLVNYVNDSGYLLIMGNWYGYFDPEYINNITAPFGVTWYDAEVLDDDDNLDSNYKIVLSNFADNPYARFLTKGSESLIFHGCTSFNVTTVEGVEFIPIVLGNNDPDSPSYLVNSSGKAMGINGSDIVAFALLKTAGEGWIALSGSSYVFRSDYSYIDYYIHNKAFIWNLLRFFFTTEFVYDTEPPTVSITSPADGSCVNSKEFWLNWTASDNVMLDRFEIYLNGELYKTVDGSERSVAITVATDGYYDVEIIAYDHLDYTDSDTISICVDSEAPTLTILAPESGEWYTTSTIVVQWSITDTFPEKLKNTKIYLDGTLVDEVLPNVTTYTLENVADGEHNVTIVASDTFNIVKSSVLFKVDTTKPTIEYFNLANNTNYTGAQTVDITLNITDNMCLQKVEILVNGSVEFTQNFPEGPTSESVTTTLTFDEVGKYFVQIKIYDCAGNIGVYTYVVNIKEKPAGVSPWVLGGIAVIVIVAIVGILIFLRKRG